MGDFLSFAEVLEKNIKAKLLQEGYVHISESPSITLHVASEATESSSKDYEHLSWLLGEIPQTTRTTDFAQTGYRPLMRPRPRRPDHVLNESQMSAFARLKALAVHLDMNFTRAELKGAFRKAALKTHPDQGGSAQAFRQVQEDFCTLQSLI